MTTFEHLIIIASAVAVSTGAYFLFLVGSRELLELVGVVSIFYISYSVMKKHWKEKWETEKFLEKYSDKSPTKHGEDKI